MPDIQLVSSNLPIAEDDDGNMTDHPAGALRLLPVVAFGLGVAALAGLIISGSAAGAGTSSYLAGVLDVTCCGSFEVSGRVIHSGGLVSGSPIG